MMSEATCRPNFFIVGAPKSGTTSLHNYLSEHPDVFMSRNKEPCFLAPDFFSPAYPQTEEEYLRCFEGYSGESRVGESTSTYLYSKLAAKRIHEYAPDAKIIAMVRNPVDLVLSLHAQRLKEGNENIARLDDALEAESDRRQGKRIPVGFRYPKEYLLYREYGKYAEQLKRYFREFGRESIHVVIFEDFKRDTVSEFAKVCHFLNISTKFKPDMRIYNPAQTPRFITLNRGFAIITPAIDAIGKWLKPIIPSRVLKLLSRAYRSFWNLNLRTGRRKDDTVMRLKLSSYYRQEIKDLEIILARDLSCWRVKLEMD